MRIAALYTSSWLKEYADVRKGSVPSHRLFGAKELCSDGHRIELYDWPRGWPHQLRTDFIWRMVQALLVVLTQWKLDVVYATTETPALPVLLLRRLGILRKPVALINVALLHPKTSHGIRRGLWRLGLPACGYVICYAESQVPLVEAYWPFLKGRVRHCPLGVDFNWVQGIAAGNSTQDILSVGTNEGKDYATLVNACPRDRSLTIVTDAHNASVALSTGTESNLTLLSSIPIAQLVSMYKAAKVLVIPLHDVSYSTGQTVLLEMLASGRRVIVTDVPVVHEYVPLHCCPVVRPGNISELTRAIEGYEQGGTHLCPACSAEARGHSVEAFSRQLARVLEELHQARPIAPL